MYRSLTLLVCISLMTGCIATHRSNTAWHEETTRVGIMLKPSPPTDAKSLAAPIALVGEIAIRVAAAALKWESSKYVKESVGELKEGSFGTLSIPAGYDGWAIEDRGSKDSPSSAYVTIIRSVKPKSELGFWESLWRTIMWFERPTKLEPLDAVFRTNLVNRVQACDSNVPDDVIHEAYGLKDIPEDTFLGFVALLQITQTQPEISTRRHPNYRIELVDYRYSSLKAKNLSWIRVPFTDWEETKSVFTLSFLGPKADIRLLGGQYNPTTEFEVKWDRENSSSAGKSKWSNLAPKPCSAALQKSPPVRAYDFRNIGIAFKLSEAGTLKEAFEKAAEKVGDLDPEKVFGK